MAISSYPFDSQDVTENQYSALFRELQDSGVVGAFGDASLRVTGDATGMQVKIAAGAAIIRGFFLSSTAQEILTISPSSTLPRIDLVVARLNTSTDSITFAVLPGLAAASPKAPALTQTDTGIFELPLASVAVGANIASISAAAVTDTRPYIGHRIGVWTTATRPLNPRRGRLGLNTSTGGWEYATGSGNAWVDLAPTITFSSLVGVPATFTPAAHTHGIGDVVGLSDAFAHRDAQISTRSLNGHTHSAAEIRDGGMVYATNFGAQSIAIGWDGASVLAKVGSVIVGGLALKNDVATKGELASLRADATAGDQGISAQIQGRALAWGGDGNAVRYAHGPHSSAYNRQAGNSRFAVWMDGDLIFGRATSSLRYKDNVSEWDIDEKALLSITPKQFHRKVDPEGEMDYGAIAEEVHALGLEWLVYYDDKGRPDALKDHLLPWALLGLARTQRADHEALLKRVEALEAAA